jgi:hypothetical protein
MEGEGGKMEAIRDKGRFGVAKSNPPGMDAAP